MSDVVADLRWASEMSGHNYSIVTFRARGELHSPGCSTRRPDDPPCKLTKVRDLPVELRACSLCASQMTWLGTSLVVLLQRSRYYSRMFALMQIASDLKAKAELYFNLNQVFEREEELAQIGVKGGLPGDPVIFERLKKEGVQFQEETKSEILQSASEILTALEDHAKTPQQIQRREALEGHADSIREVELLVKTAPACWGRGVTALLKERFLLTEHVAQVPLVLLEQFERQLQLSARPGEPAMPEYAVITPGTAAHEIKAAAVLLQDSTGVLTPVEALATASLLN